MTNRLLLTTALFALAGCGGSDDVCEEGGRGDIDLTISGLPETARASIKLTGPGEERVVTEAGRVTNLATGQWTVAADPVASPGGRVRRAFDATPTTLCVRDGSAAGADVAYGEIGSSSKLWLSAQNSAGPLLAFASSLLMESRSTQATVAIIAKPEIPSGSGIAFDKRGNLWAANPGGKLHRFPAGILAAGGTRDADVVLTSDSFGGGVPGPVNLAFDGAGNLWVSAGAARKIVRFTPDQLLNSGDPVAAVEISTAPDVPDALAFDSAGNLWASVGSRVNKYAASRLGASIGTADASLRLMNAQGTNAALGTATGLAFDGAGNLWSAHFAQNVISRLNAGELTGDGVRDVTPAVQLGLTVSVLLDGLAFDEDGGLWTPLGSGNFGRLSQAQLSASGSVTPEVVITSTNLRAGHQVALYPAPAATPLFHRLE